MQFESAKARDTKKNMPVHLGKQGNCNYDFKCMALARGLEWKLHEQRAIRRHFARQAAFCRHCMRKRPYFHATSGAMPHAWVDTCQNNASPKFAPRSECNGGSVDSSSTIFFSTSATGLISSSPPRWTLMAVRHTCPFALHFLKW